MRAYLITECMKQYTDLCLSDFERQTFRSHYVYGEENAMLFNLGKP